MEAIKKDKSGSVLIKDNKIEVWMDVWKEDGEYISEWNKYIFFTNCDKDMNIKKYQEDINNYINATDVAIKYITKK